MAKSEIVARIWSGEAFEFLGETVTYAYDNDSGGEMEKISIIFQVGKKFVKAFTDDKGRCNRLGKDDEVVKFKALLPKGEYCGNI